MSSTSCIQVQKQAIQNVGTIQNAARQPLAKMYAFSTQGKHELNSIDIEKEKERRNRYKQMLTECLDLYKKIIDLLLEWIKMLEQTICSHIEWLKCEYNVMRESNVKDSIEILNEQARKTYLPRVRDHLSAIATKLTRNDTFDKLLKMQSFNHVVLTSMNLEQAIKKCKEFMIKMLEGSAELNAVKQMPFSDHELMFTYATEVYKKQLHYRVKEECQHFFEWIKN